MAYMRPGGTALTDRGLALAGLREGSKILDIGCGDGDTVAYLNETKGMAAQGIDMNLAKIAEAKEAHPGIQVQFGDGEFLDSFMSYTFDGVLMESSLGLINMPDEALHEAFCVLKKGGKLVISDLYERDPERDQLRAVRIEADRQAKIPHKEGDCEDRGLKFVNFRFEGAFYEQPLIRQLEEIGFHVIGFEDHSQELEDYLQAADAKAGLTALNKYLKTTNPNGRKRDIGYFLLAAVKPL